MRLTIAIGNVASAALLSACAHLLLPGVASPSATLADQATAARLAERFDTLRGTLRIPGLAVVVLRDTTVILSRGFGYANLERAVTVTPETPFNIASVTKPISAVVALRLVERSLLDLDRPLTTYAGFTEFCNSALKSGGIFFRDYGCAQYPVTLRHMLSMQMNGVPGTRFLYNPTSYSWASRPMAQVSGRTFSALTTADVFSPAGMLHSARIHRQLGSPPALASQLAAPYQVNSSGHFIAADPPPAQGDGAAGGVISTAMDLARFDIALSEGRLLSPASQRAMWTAGVAPSGAVLPYGLGWFVQEFGGERLLWHSGLWDGAYSALYLKAPNRRLTLILLANSDGLKWDNGLDEAAVHRSPFVAAFLEAFPR